MSVLGIIAEFNPLHNGHLYFIRSAQQTQNFTATICVMSGNFVQRGEAALCNKWSRTRMALQAGVDLVIELPFCFTVRSAYFFARGGIQMLHRTGMVSHLAFGSESGNLHQLQAIATIIANENLAYKTQLKKYLAQGLSFPAARAQTIRAITGQQFNLDSIIMQPNNILALEYLRVLEQEAIPIQPLTVFRKGSGYNSPVLSSYASSSAIRHSLLEKPLHPGIKNSMPPNAWAFMQREIQSGRAPVFTNALEQALLIKLRNMSVEDLHRIHEVNEGLEYRIQEAAMTSGTLEELKHAIKSKRYSMTRINRLLLYALLNLETQQLLSFDQHGPLYIHILGFSTKGRKILQEMKNKTSLRILNRGSDVKDSCQDRSNPVLQSMLELDVQASNIYTLLYPNSAYRHGNQDFTTSPIIIND